MIDLLRGLRWQDGVDVALLAVGIYSVANVIRGTRAVPMLIGLGMLFGLYLLSGRLEIYTVNLLLRYVLGWSIVLIVIVFQGDIRRMLTQVGTGPLFSREDRVAQNQAVEEIVRAVSPPVHDGALIVQGGRLTAAGCVLPLTSNPGVSRTLGTRHRAAIGITEETDAVVLVVSEEDGTISLVHQGRMTRDVDPGTLRVTLQRLLLG
jgi:diadenylate cyclase